MDLLLEIVLCLVVGYLFGNLSTAWFVGKFKKVDLRKCGSGNLGTTNVMRTLGKKWGIITYLGDVLKVALPVIIVKYFLYAGEDYAALLGMYIGFGAVIGHCYPFWLNFKGGKGIAAMSAVMISYDLLIVPVGVPLFFITIYTTKYVSVGSLVISILFPVWVALRSGIMDPNPYFWHMLVVGLLYTASAFFMHRSNIKRIIDGTENKVGKKKTT